MTVLVSAFLPFLPTRHEAILPYAALVQWTVAARLWQGHSPILDPHDTFIYAAAAGFRIPSAIGVNLTPVRTAYQAATQARSTAIASGNEFVAGYGPGEAELQTALLGSAYTQPARETAAYVSTIGKVLASRASNDSDVVDASGKLQPLPSPQVRLAIGALRQGMARHAGHAADIIVGWMTPPNYYTRIVYPASAESARQAGRAPPETVIIAPTAVKGTKRDSERVLMSGVQSHLHADPYRKMLQSAGVESRSRTQQFANLVSSGAVLHGTVKHIHSLIRMHEDLGVNELVLNLTGTHQELGPDAARSDLIEILEVI